MWDTVLRELLQLYPTHACQEFLRNFPLFNFRSGHVPQLQEMSLILQYEPSIFDTCQYTMAPVDAHTVPSRLSCSMSNLY